MVQHVVRAEQLLDGLLSLRRPLDAVVRLAQGAVDLIRVDVHARAYAGQLPPLVARQRSGKVATTREASTGLAALGLLARSHCDAVTV